MGHSCHALGCLQEVPPRLLFCGRHWHMTSPEVQGLVWQFYRNGQEYDKRPSAAYLIAQRLAVAEVAYREDRISSTLAIDGVTEILDRFGHCVELFEREALERVIPFDWLDIPF